MPTANFLLRSEGRILFVLRTRSGVTEPRGEPGLIKRASALSLDTAAVAREACMAAGNGWIMDPDGATKILQARDDYFAPALSTQFPRRRLALLQFGRTPQTTGECVGRFPPSSSASRVADASGGFVSRNLRCFFRVRNASPFRPDKSLVLGSTRGNSGIVAAGRDMGHSFGPIGGAVRR